MSVSQERPTLGARLSLRHRWERTAYSKLLDRQSTTVMVASFVGRLPAGMNSLAMVLAVHEVTSSYWKAGLCVAASTIASALFNPIRSRALGGRHANRALRRIVWVNACATLTFAFLVMNDAGSSATLVLTAMFVGASMPPIGQAVRNYWRGRASSDDVEAAYAMEGVLEEGFYVVGPVLVAVATLASSAWLALFISGVLTLCGGLATARATSRVVWEEPGAHGGRRGFGMVLLQPGVALATLVTLALGVTLGCLDVAAPAIAGHEGQRTLGPLILSALAFGSGIGGLAWGLRTWRLAVWQRGAAVALCSSLALTVGTLGLDTPWLLLTIWGAGLAISPVTACTFVVSDAAAGIDASEAQGWLGSAYVGGISLGAVVAGALASQADLRLLLLSAAAMAVASIAFALVGMTTPWRPDNDRSALSEEA